MCVFIHIYTHICIYICICKFFTLKIKLLGQGLYLWTDVAWFKLRFTEAAPIPFAQRSLWECASDHELVCYRMRVPWRLRPVLRITWCQSEICYAVTLHVCLLRMKTFQVEKTQDPKPCGLQIFVRLKRQLTFSPSASSHHPCLLLKVRQHHWPPSTERPLGLRNTACEDDLKGT